MTLAELYNLVFNKPEVLKRPHRNEHYKNVKKENSNIAVLSYQTLVI